MSVEYRDEVESADGLSSADEFASAVESGDGVESRAATASWRAHLVLLPRRTVIFLIELYRTWVSPMRLPTCRFEPTCSGYAVEALSRHGFWYGGLLSIVRLLKCGPWHKPGYDPVPERRLSEIKFSSNAPSVISEPMEREG